MIDIIEWIRQTCLNNCEYAYADVLPVDKNNAVAIRTLTRDRVDKLNGDNAYNLAMIQVLYRGTPNRLTSLEIAEAMSEQLNQLTNVELTDTTIIHSHAQAAVFAFIDDNQNINYSITLDIEYGGK